MPTMRKRLLPLGLLVLAGAGIAAYVIWSRPTALVLTGIVTTNDVIVSPQIAGQIRELRSWKGTRSSATRSSRVIAPDELRADRAYYASSAQGLTSQVQESEAALRFQQQQTVEPDPAGRGDAGVDEGAAASAEADLESARLAFERSQKLVAPRHRHEGAVRPGADGVRRREGPGRVAREAGRRRAVRRRARARQRRAGRDAAQPGAGQPASAGRCQRAAGKGRRPAGVHGDARADRRHRRRPRGAAPARSSTPGSRS